MAILLSAKTNVDNTDTDFPLGKIKNDTGVGDGTPIDEEVYQDFHQFFAKMLLDSGITANGLHDNLTNGYQYFQALQKLMGYSPWVDASGAFAITVVGGGSFTAYTLNYSRYRLIGKTLQWQLRITGATIAGTITSICIDRPTTSVAAYVNADMEFPVASDGSTSVNASLAGVSGPAQISIVPVAGGNFTTGTNRNYFINITAEIT